MASLFPCSPVIREWSWKKTQTEKKKGKEKKTLNRSRVDFSHLNEHKLRH